MTETTPTFVVTEKNHASAETSMTVEHRLEVEEPASTARTGLLRMPPEIYETSAWIIAVGVYAVGCLMILLMIPTIQLFVGWKFLNQCPVDWRIPHYSIITGVFGFVLPILLIIHFILSFISPLMSTQNNNINIPHNRNFVTDILRHSSVSLRSVMVFFCLRFIVGCVLIFEAWNRLQYNHPEQSDYCHPILYRINFFLIVISLPFHLWLFSRQIALQRLYG